MSKNKILCSAIYVDDERKYEGQPKNIELGFVVCGRRHHNCFATIRMIFEELENLIPYKKAGKVTQGFLTSDDIFLNRKDAFKVAKDAGQIKGKLIGGVLTSEDLW